MGGQTIRETDLFPPVRDFFERRDYVVHAEVDGCDVTARKGDDLIVVELKRHLSVDLLVQAVDRLRITDAVYVAVPTPPDFGRGARWRGIERLMKRLEIGLIVVHLDRAVARAEIVLHPLPAPRRTQPARRKALIAEFEGRTANFNEGGQRGRKLLTAYREQAIHIACCLDVHGSLSPRQLRAMGTGKKTTAILYRDHYEWFARVTTGVYRLRKKAKRELAAWPELSQRYRELAIQHAVVSSEKV